MQKDKQWFKPKPSGFGWWPANKFGWAAGVTYSIYGFSLTAWFFMRPNLSDFTAATYLLGMAAGITALQLVARAHSNSADWSQNSSHQY